MVYKAPIYDLKGLIGNPELLDQLRDAMAELEDKMKASVSIKRNTIRQSIVYGVNKTQRGIAADSVISVAKAIKALKGW